jgi:hypothetical protein
MRDRIYVQKLTDMLVRLKAITSQEAHDLYEGFMQSEHEQFDEFLLDQGLVDKVDLLQALSKVYQVPYMDVTGYFFDTFLLHQFPLDFLLSNVIIPYEQDGDMLLMVAADPSDPELLAKIGVHVSYDINFNVGLYTDIIDAIREYYEASLTEPISEEKRVQNRDLNDLPVGREVKDNDAFLKDKIQQFEEHASKKDVEEVNENAHNAEKKKK